MQRVDLILKIQENTSLQDPFLAAADACDVVVSEDDALGITVTRHVATRATEADEMINDLNIILFHADRDTIVRHYYIVNADPSQPLGEILLSNLYLGNYRFYVVANNGRSLCSDHTSETGCHLTNEKMADLMSSAIPAGQKPYFNLMVYSDMNFQIKRSKQQFSFTMQRLTARYDVELINNWTPIQSGTPKESVELIDYSIINVPVRTKLFSSYRPLWTDLAILANVKISDNFKESFTMIGNMQGEVAASSHPRYQDRNASNAPENASCMRVYAIYHEKDEPNRNISYLIYLGGPGEKFNNYDVIGGQKYSYRVTFKKPNFTTDPDPRITSFTVLDEDEQFTDGMSFSKFKVPEVISRPLTIEYSKVFANDTLYITCLEALPPYPVFRYTVYSTNGGVETLLHRGVWSEPIVRLAVPTVKESTGMDRANLRITYEQSTPADAMLILRLDTQNGQLHTIPSQNVKYQ